MSLTQPQPARPWLERIFISPFEPRLRAGWRLLGQLFIMMALTILGGIPLAILMSLFRLPLQVINPLGQLISALVITLSIYLSRRLLDRRLFSSLGLQISWRTIWDLLAGVAIAGLMMGLIFALEWALGWLHVDGFAWQMQPEQVVWQSVLSALFMFVLVGWQEELVFRGYQLQNIADGLNLTWGVLLSSLIFSLAHLANPGASLTSVLGILAAGMFLAFGYLRTHQLWLPIGLHIGWNFFEGVVFGFPVSGLDIFKLAKISINGPELFTGGSFGPEAGLVLLPGLALGVALVYGYTKLTGVRPKPLLSTPLA